MIQTACAFAMSLCWLMALVPLQAAERHIVRYQGLTASIADGSACGYSLHISVQAPDAGAYAGDRLALQRLLGGVRAALSTECPQLSTIDVSGFANGRSVFQATLTAADGWRLPPAQANTGETKKQLGSPEHLRATGQGNAEEMKRSAHEFLDLFRDSINKLLEGRTPASARMAVCREQTHT